MPLGVEVGLGPGHVVVDRNPGPAPLKGAQLPSFWPVSLVAKCSPISAAAEHLYV